LRAPDERIGCKARVDALEARLTELRTKLDELRDSARSIETPSRGAVRDAEDAVRDVMLHGTQGQRKALLKELVVEVRVESRDSIISTFRLPPTRFALRKAWWAAVDSNHLRPRYSALRGLLLNLRCRQSGRRYEAWRRWRSSRAADGWKMISMATAGVTRNAAPIVCVKGG
jgi:hypothetical protein